MAGARRAERLKVINAEGDGQERLALEYMAVKEHFGKQAKICTDQHRENFWWECRLPSGSRGRTVLIFYPDGYPASPPKVVFVGRLRRGTPHVMFGKVLDVCYGYGFWNRQCTAATAMLAATRWFREYDAWRETGRWPATDAMGTR